MQQECKSVFEIYTGNNKPMTLRFLNSSGDPVDLTNCTEIDVALPKADGTTGHATKTGGAVTIPDPKVLGKAVVAGSAIAALSLNPGEYQDFTATLTIGTEVITVGFPGQLTVRAP